MIYTIFGLSFYFQCDRVLKLSVEMHLLYLFTEPSLLLANQVENLSPQSSLSVQLLCGRGRSLLHLYCDELNKLLWLWSSRCSLKLVRVTRIKKAGCFLCSAVHSFVGKEVFLKRALESCEMGGGGGKAPKGEHSDLLCHCGVFLKN